MKVTYSEKTKILQFKILTCNVQDQIHLKCWICLWIWKNLKNFIYSKLRPLQTLEILRNYPFTEKDTKNTVLILKFKYEKFPISISENAVHSYKEICLQLMIYFVFTKKDEQTLFDEYKLRYANYSGTYRHIADPIFLCLLYRLAKKVLLEGRKKAAKSGAGIRMR